MIARSWTAEEATPKLVVTRRCAMIFRHAIKLLLLLLFGAAFWHLARRTAGEDSVRAR